MHFPEGQRGVSKLFASEIIQIISAIAIFVSIILLTTGVVGAIIGIILAAVALVADLIAYIFNLVGLHSAGVADKSFKTGFTFAIVALICAIVGGILAFIIGGITMEVTEAVCTIIDIIIVIYVCAGVSSLAGQIKGQEELSATADKLKTVIIILFVASIIFGLVGGIFIYTLPALSTILAICYIITKVAAYIMYLVILARAKAAF